MGLIPSLVRHELKPVEIGLQDMNVRPAISSQSVTKSPTPGILESFSKIAQRILVLFCKASQRIPVLVWWKQMALRKNDGISDFFSVLSRIMQIRQRHTFQRCDVIQYMLSNRPEFLTMRDNNGRTLLSLAAEKGDGEVVAALLNYKAVEINSEDNQGCTPLHYAVKSNCEDVVYALLDNSNVNVNHQDKNGRTTLHEAAQRRYLNCVRALLAHENIKPSVIAKDTSGYTPFDYAVQSNRSEVVKAFSGSVDSSDIYKYMLNAEPLDNEWVQSQQDLCGIVDYVRLHLNEFGNNPIAVFEKIFVEKPDLAISVLEPGISLLEHVQGCLLSLQGSANTNDANQSAFLTSLQAELQRHQPPVTSSSTPSN